MMADKRTSILVVDDAKFSSAMINRVMSRAGYRDVRHADSASNAIAALEIRPADILIADWLMPEMDGLELTQRVRQLDEAANHFTYVLLLTAKEGVEALAEAFEQGVDDFVNKAHMQDQLLPRLLSAERMTHRQNSLLKENQQLIDHNAILRKTSSFDPMTGLGNRDYARRRLEETLNQVQSRGGAACYILLTLSDFSLIRQQHPPAIQSQLQILAARRLRQLVRPMDVVAQVSPYQFVVITHQADLRRCRRESFQRIHDAMNLKAFKTAAGFLSVQVQMVISACDNEHPATSAESLMQHAQAHTGSRTDNRIIVAHWDSDRLPA